MFNILCGSSKKHTLYLETNMHIFIQYLLSDKFDIYWIKYLKLGMCSWFSFHMLRFNWLYYSIYTHTYIYWVGPPKNTLRGYKLVCTFSMNLIFTRVNISSSIHVVGFRFICFISNYLYYIIYMVNGCF